MIVASHLHGREIAWNHLKQHFNDWYKLYDGGFIVQRLVKIPQYFITDQKADEIQQFYSNITFPQCQRSMKQCIEYIRKNALWHQISIQQIQSWCQQNIVKIKKLNSNM